MTKMKLPVSVVILAAILLGLAFPKGVILKDLVFPFLFLLMYINSLELSLEPRKFLRKELFILLASNIIALPLIAYLIGSSLSQYLLLGLVIAISAPVGINSPLFVGLIKGDKELSVSAAAISNLGFMVYMPLTIFLLFGTSAAIPYGQMMMNMIMLIPVPIFLAFLSRKVLKEKYGKLAGHSRLLIPPLLFVFLWILLSLSADKIWSSLHEVFAVMPIVIFLATVGCAIGFVSGKGRILKRTLAVICGYKNETIVLAIAYGIDPLAVIPPTIYIVSQHVFNAILVWLFEKGKI